MTSAVVVMIGTKINGEFIKFGSNERKCESSEVAIKRYEETTAHLAAHLKEVSEDDISMGVVHNVVMLVIDRKPERVTYYVDR